jgi:hypothetical protein
MWTGWLKLESAGFSETLAYAIQCTWHLKPKEHHQIATAVKNSNLTQ